MKKEVQESRIESEAEIKLYIQKSNYALDNGARLTFQERRLVDENREERYTNKYTVAELFPDEDPVVALKRELRKLAQDPEWFLQLLKERKENLNSTAFEKYVTAATTSYEAAQDSYLRKAIEAKYARIQSQREYNGNANLNLDKVIDVIRYYASSTAVKGLYKVKLMKMLWYGDNLAYKQRDHAITGLAYQALPMGAVPIGHDSIIELKEVPCEEIEMGDGTAYRFKLSTPCVFAVLTEEEKEILDKVIKRVGRMTTEEIVNFMHQEEAYKKTKLKDMIDFKYAKELQL